MKNILERITQYKFKEVKAKKEYISEVLLTEIAIKKARKPLSLKESILNSTVGIIAEFKRRSPSKGEINGSAQVDEVVNIYENHNAAGCSILTDTPFFGGSLSDLMIARKSVNIPLLRKDFIIDSYQILEAYISGADAILLIASILSAEQMGKFTELAHSLGLEVLVEIHSEEEALKVPLNADLVGINNRNLKNFETNLANSARLIKSLPTNSVKIAESGINSVDDLKYLKNAGFDGFLIGEALMKNENPGRLLDSLING